MMPKSFWKLIILSFAFTLGLSILFLLTFNRFISNTTSGHRNQFLMFMASEIQDQIQNKTILEIRQNPNLLKKGPRMPFGPPPQMGRPESFGKLPPPPPPMGFLPGRPPRPEPTMWLLNENGGVVLEMGSQKLPQKFSSLILPKEYSQFTIQEDFFRLFPALFIIKLRTQDGPLYFVVHDTMKPFGFPLLLSQFLFSLGMLLIAALTAAAMTFVYLRKKSIEARVVLSKLEQGDLKARFPIRRFDEFASLLLDFNRMADEIESLVNRLYTVESTRKDLLQELGHDLRTPLTTIQTSFETLKNYSNRMTEIEKNQLHELIQGEITYVNELFDKLMGIAQLDDPHYKKSTKNIDLAILLSEEIHNRQKTPQQNLIWKFDRADISQAHVLGDFQMILRLVRNAFDNASRFAKTEVQVRLQKSESFYEIEIQDDGPGFDLHSLTEFGKRKEFASRKLRSDQHYSLGLGSVIMKTVAELHRGSVTAQNVEAPATGARIIVRLPASTLS